MCNQCDSRKYQALEAANRVCGHTKYEGKEPCGCNPEEKALTEEISTLLDCIERVLELHKEIPGPYDNTICEHCTMITLIERPDAPEYAFILYPCPTVNALDAV